MSGLVASLALIGGFIVVLVVLLIVARIAIFWLDRLWGGR